MFNSNRSQPGRDKENPTASTQSKVELAAGFTKLLAAVINMGNTILGHHWP